MARQYDKIDRGLSNSITTLQGQVGGLLSKYRYHHYLNDNTVATGFPVVGTYYGIGSGNGTNNPLALVNIGNAFTYSTYLENGSPKIQYTYNGASGRLFLICITFDVLKSGSAVNRSIEFTIKVNGVTTTKSRIFMNKDDEMLLSCQSMITLFNGDILRPTATNIENTNNGIFRNWKFNCIEL